jgi:hypothetical protein
MTFVRLPNETFKPLLNGDFLLVLEDDPVPLGKDVHEVYQVIARTSYHGMVLYTDNNKDFNVMHSSQGMHQMGIKNHTLLRMVIYKERYAVLGAYCVFRPTQNAIGTLAAKAAHRFNPPKLTEAQYHHRQRTTINQLILPTPYASERKASESDETSIRYEIYRAFRSYLRSHTPYIEPHTRLALTAEPMSKKKGVSCSMFISTIYKIAEIEASFPQGVSNTILDCIKNIELLKKGMIKVDESEMSTGKKYTKLAELDARRAELIKKDPGSLTIIELEEKKLLDQFNDFVTLVQNNLPDQDPEKVQKIMNKLSLSVKGADISFFTHRAFSNTEDWEFMGFLCYIETSKDKYEPRIISLDTYNKFMHENPKNSSLQLQTADIEKLERTIRTSSPTPSSSICF